MKKKIALLMACVMAFGVAVGGTLAWLTDDTDPVTNVFTPSDIAITLKEHTYNAEEDKLTTTETTEGVSNYKMVPGHTIPKDPWATVEAGSEACYLFVEIEKSQNFGAFFEEDYEIADGWTTNDPNLPANVIYRRVDKSDVDQKFEILKDNKVKVRETVTKDMMNGLTAETAYPKLTFTAYAVQQYNSNYSQFTAAKAWETIQAPTADPGFGTP